MSKMTLQDYYERFKKAQDKDFNGWQKYSAIEIALNTCGFFFIYDFEREVRSIDKVLFLICDWAIKQKCGFKTALFSNSVYYTNGNKKITQSFNEMIESLNPTDFCEDILYLVNRDIENGLIFDDKDYPTKIKEQLKKLFINRQLLICQDIEEKSLGENE